MLTKLLGTNGVISTKVMPLFHTITAADPHNVLTWLRDPHLRNALHAIGRTTKPLTHELFDQLAAASPAVESLRTSLVATGTLPTRDDRLRRLEGWVDEQRRRPGNTDHAYAIACFARWHRLRRLRARNRSTIISAGQANVARRDIRTAVDFLLWLESRGGTIADCTQHDIDAWLTVGPATGHLAAPFVQWAVAHHRAPPGLHIESWRPPPTLPSIDADARWALTRRLLHDAHIPTADRVAGLLVLLYAQPLTKIVALRAADVSAAGGAVRLGLAPVHVPPPIDGLLSELVNQRSGGALFDRRGQNAWLFPGARTGQAMSARHLMRRLNRVGIMGRSARNAALMDLAQHLPAAVLAQLLGLHPSTGVTWAHRSGATYAPYAADINPGS